MNYNDNELTELWTELYPKVYGYFYRRVNSRTDVEELTASTMNTVFTAKRVDNIYAYLWKVAHNHLVKYINTKTTSPIIVSMDENLDAWQPEYSEYELTEQPASGYNQRIQDLLDCVKANYGNPDDERLLFMSLVEEKNSTQIAILLNLSSDNVRQRLSRLVKKIRVKCSAI